MHSTTSTARPVAGHVAIQRMTRTEYGIAVKDLLGVEIDAENLLPTEIEVGGFDNIAAALSVSPAFLDQYVGAARLAAKLAVGDAVPKQASARYPLPPGDQAAHIDGLPLGTRGGMKFRHNFPADGEYRFTVLDLDVGLYTRTLETRHTLILLVDGREVFRKALGGPEDLGIVDHGGAPGRARDHGSASRISRCRYHAGFHDVVVTFIERAEVETDEFVSTANDRRDLSDSRFARSPHDRRRHRRRAVQLARRIEDARAASAFSFASRKPDEENRLRPHASSKTWRAARSAGLSQKRTSIP